MQRALSSLVGPVQLALTLFRLPQSASIGGICPLQPLSTSTLCGSPHLGVVMSTVLHTKARGSPYPGSNTARQPVPDEHVPWNTPWPEYNPPNYTAPSVAAKPVWADPDIGAFSPRFNALDGNVDRQSHEGQYPIKDQYPLNPHGRTGLCGRGLLGRWGPNHAADPIVTRWKTDNTGNRVAHTVSKLPILQFVSIKRKDCGEWAIPGGMVDPGEVISQTLQREFSEEALNSLDANHKTELHDRITQLFSSPGLEVFKGYVDDPRNTDNSWMETVAVNFHDELGDSVSALPLQAGDDAGQVSWIDVGSNQPLYASHSHFLETVAKKHQAHW